MTRTVRHGGLLLLVGAAFATAILIQRGGITSAEGSASEPVMHWVFEQNRVSGRTLSPMVGNLKAEIRGEPNFLGGKPTDAIEFKGDNDFVMIRNRVAADADFLPKKAISVSAWVRLDVGTRFGGIVGIVQDNGDNGRGWSLGYNESHFNFALSASGADPAKSKLTYLKAKSPFLPGQWSHVVGTFDGKTMRLFVNGQEEATSDAQTGTIAYPASAPFVIGRYRDSDEDFPMRGALKEVLIHDRVLSAAEIAKAFSQQKSLSELPATKASEPRFVMKPYLQNPTQTSMTIMWETSMPGTSIVEYGPTPKDLKRIEVKGEATIHEVPIEGLQVETNYIYRVSTADAEGRSLTSPFFQFMTAVKDDSAFSFAVIGDTQKNPKMTAKIAKRMFERRPHFVMHCGDVVDNGPDKQEWVHELFGPCQELFARSPVMPCIGNHEKNHDWYYKYFSLPKPEYFYSYRYGNAEFFSLDSNKSLKPDTEQFKWLDEQLGKSTATWKIVYHHHPVWTSDSDDYGDMSIGPSKLGDGNARNLMTLYEKHKVDLVFNGHIHLYERTWPLREGKVNRKQGVTYITSGGGGGSLEDFGPLPTWFKAQLRVDFHHCYVNVQGGKLEFKAFDQNGQLFDSFEMEK